MAENKMGNETGRGETGLAVFEYESTAIRCGGTADRPWVVVQDVCDALGIQDVGELIRRLPSEETDVCPVGPPGVGENSLVVYEAGLFRLLFELDTPKVRSFRARVLCGGLPALYPKNVLESFRKSDGSYLGYKPSKSFVDLLVSRGVPPGPHLDVCILLLMEPVLSLRAPLLAYKDF